MLSTWDPDTGGDDTTGILINNFNSYGFFCETASPAGDVNADGLDDFILGLRTAGSTGDVISPGESYVILGRDAP